MRTIFTLLCFCVFATFTATALAQTPDGEPPSVEEDCINEFGAAFGLCNAYCEAMDCDCPTDDNPTCEPNANQRACDRVKDRYQQVTGNEDLPCDATEPPPEPASCPCGVDPDTYTTDIAWSDDPYDSGFSSAGFLWNDGATGALAGAACNDGGEFPTLWPAGDGMLMLQSMVDGTENLVTIRATETGWECSASQTIGGFPVMEGTLAITDAAVAAACRVDLLAGCS